MQTALRTALMRLTQGTTDRGIHATPVQGVEIVRLDRPSRPVHTLHGPALVMVLQGSKRMMVGDRVFHYVPLSYAVVGVALPVVGAVVEATPEQPYLALKLDLDLGLLHDVRQTVGDALGPRCESAAGHFVGSMDRPLTACAGRLVDLLEERHAIAALAPGILRELHYRLATGPHGAALAQLTLPDSHAQRIARTIATMKRDLHRPVRVADWAAGAGMSPSSFHEHFKRMTCMAPMQYRKQLRLLEARRLMLTKGASAMGAAFASGYGSATQFSRDYARAFGLPPKRDAERQRVS